MSVFDVRELVTARQAAERVGLRFVGNRAFCPFHDDGKHPALSFFHGGFRCFACGTHGDAITLYALYYDLSALDAARKLAQDFQLQTSDAPPTKDAARAYRARQQRQEDVRAALDTLAWADQCIRTYDAPRALEIPAALVPLLRVQDRIQQILEDGNVEDGDWKVVSICADAKILIDA